MSETEELKLENPEPGLGEAEFIELLELAGETHAVGGGRLFVPELVLGPGHVAEDDARRIVEHLVAVAQARDIPLHSAVAWNCLYFGYSTQLRGYDVSLCGALNLPKVEAERRIRALPVGALVEYSSGTKAEHREWAEVVYKEGRPHNALEDDGFRFVAPEFSGSVGFLEAPSPAGATIAGQKVLPGSVDYETEIVLEELLVLDFAPFGPLAPNAQSWLERARSAPERTYIDELGHIEIEASYVPAVEAETQDATYFCNWMIDNHARLLALGWLGAALERPDDSEDLLEALYNSMAAIEAILDTSTEFERWGSYWYLRSSYDALVTERDAPGGMGDAGTLLSQLASVPFEKRVAYHPLSMMIGLVGQDLLTYQHYARTIVFTNAMIAERLGQVTDGVIHKAGEPIGVRLDDRWLFGGTWRAERLDELTTCSLIGIDPTRPLGLGATDEDRDVHEPIEPDPDEILDESDVDAVPDGQPVFWSVALTGAMRAEGRLRLDPSAGIVAGDDGTVVLRIEHAGDIEYAERVQRVALSADGRWAAPVAFPFDFFDGIRVFCLARRGGSAVQAGTELLSGPGTEGGPRFAYDPSIVDPRRARRPEPKLVDVAITMIDRHGQVRPNGWKRLDAERIAQLIFGREVGAPGIEAVTNALEGARERVLFDDDGWWAHRRGGPAVPLSAQHEPAEGGFFSGASEKLRASFAGAEARHRAQCRVVMHLRRLFVAERADEERRALYRRARPVAPNRESLPLDLPDGYTFVVEHRRGGSHEH